MLIRVVPSNGGTARTLVSEQTNRVFLQDWSADGRYLYYRRRDYEAPWTYPPLLRVAVDGGSPEFVTEVPDGSTAPNFPFRVERVSRDWESGPPHEVQTYLGDPVARLILPENASTMDAGLTFSPDGKQLLAVVSNGVRPLRLLPVEGGSPRQLGETRSSERPLGWSPDGQNVLFSTTLDGRTSIMSAPVEGGAAQEVGPMPDRGPPERSSWRHPIIFSSDGQYLMYSKPTPGSPNRTLLVRPTAGGEDRLITRSLRPWGAFGLAGPGGTPLIAGEDFLYLESVGEGEYELRATPPEGPSRLIRSGAIPSPYGALGVFEDRVAYPKDGSRTDPYNPATAGRILVAKGPEGALKEVAVLPGAVTFDDIVWSFDGQWIAANAYYASEDGDCCVTKVVVVGVTADGEVSVPARAIDTPIPGSAWSLRWLPDQSAVVLYGQRLPDWGFDIWLIPVQNGGRPVALTRDDTDHVDFNILSPDGRYIAYQAFVNRGTSLWLADLGDALERIGK
jgi:Tol biopolymer transport system component